MRTGGSPKASAAATSVTSRTTLDVMASGTKRTMASAKRSRREGVRWRMIPPGVGSGWKSVAGIQSAVKRKGRCVDDRHGADERMFRIAKYPRTARAAQEADRPPLGIPTSTRDRRADTAQISVRALCQSYDTHLSLSQQSELRPENQVLDALETTFFAEEVHRGLIVQSKVWFRQPTNRFSRISQHSRSQAGDLLNFSRRGVTSGPMLD
jgi:hypothetical protein